MIRIQGLHKYFNRGRQNEIHVINDVSLELPERGMVAIFGRSGCGKTTLLNVIGGLDGFARGEVTLAGQDVRRNTDELRNRYVGYIFQNYNLLPAISCYDNVANALRLCGVEDEEVIGRRVMAALRCVGMEHYSRRPPETLSGGQMQRIAIARAIVKNPRIILADEPTGNLDEANTLMIMDLLKAISRDHLVLLVTHEAELVDHYCDRVIELSDGQVVSIRQNEDAEGLAARDKNDIYLGELTRSELSDGNTHLTYYGTPPAEPVRLTLVHHEGKLYLQLDDAQSVHLLDSSGEIRLREGVFEEKRVLREAQGSVDMSELPPLREVKRCGRLFSLRASIQSGYRANFHRSKRGKRLLRGCLCLFAAVVVLMSAVFGSSFEQLIDAGNAYNHNVFYVYAPADGSVSDALAQAAAAGTVGIDSITLSGTYPWGGDTNVAFRLGSFESFTDLGSTTLSTNAVLLPLSLADALPLTEGSREGLGADDVLITSRVADALLESSTFGYIEQPRDLIGLLTRYISPNGRALRVAGIVESDETAVYLDALTLARYRMSTRGNPPLIHPASEAELTVAQGSVLLAISYRNESMTYPEVGQSVLIEGVELQVAEVRELYASYEEWLAGNGISVPDEGSFFAAMVKEQHPELTEGTEEFAQAFEAMYAVHYWEYFEAYTQHMADFLADYYFFMHDLNAWLYLEKGVEEVKYLWTHEYHYGAIAYHEKYGKYPTLEELHEALPTLPTVYDTLQEYYRLHEEEFYQTDHRFTSDRLFYLSDEDYVTVASRRGESHISAQSNWYDYDLIQPREEKSEYLYDGMPCYAVIHSSDPEATEAYLYEQFGALEPPEDYLSALLTPAVIRQELLQESAAGIIAALIAMGVLLLLMGVCMYFIMRSSLMVRIREVGIYRAIGVSRKNLVFRFVVEALVLSTLTVTLGYLLTSGFMLASLELSALVEEVFYFPAWLALADLAVLYALSLFCGTLPITSLLRRSPSEILAKYDI